ncbi:histidinol-phosphatase [Aulographum hederae CBS 113979]|uniref:Histidinol-phosphatase n=1 Tax=Aulographum hederae CBS 113979 TaxID=1176131 RepID=A0A6G1GPD3_9PEZI|nr:histidinol-phosphatase [Aulographum hederae CBS 113979]
MPFSHHSHSGQFCSHAKDSLEDMVKTAISRKMQVFALTEHIPRSREDFYPEEVGFAPELYDEAGLFDVFDKYHAEAVRLRDAYKSQIDILIGFESEWIRPESLSVIEGIREKYHFDLFMGSIHHVKTVPIDFDLLLYEKARALCGGTDEGIFEQFFDEQYDMLQKLQPPIVGHFDLIRLKSDAPDASMKKYAGVWDRIVRNLKSIQGYGGILELNSSALRKGKNMKEPYPQVDVCKVFLEMGGSFTLSDDSHEMGHIGQNYHGVLDAVKRAGIPEIRYFHRGKDGEGDWKGTVTSSMPVSALSNHEFFTVVT